MSGRLLSFLLLIAVGFSVSTYQFDGAATSVLWSRGEGKDASSKLIALVGGKVLSGTEFTDVSDQLEPNVRAIYQHAQDPSKMYALGETTNIYVSSGENVQFKAAGSLPNDESCVTLTLHPVYPSMLVCSLIEPEVCKMASCNNKIYLSNDSGTSWILLHSQVWDFQWSNSEEVLYMLVTQNIEGAPYTWDQMTGRPWFDTGDVGDIVSYNVKSHKFYLVHMNVESFYSNGHYMYARTKVGDESIQTYLSDLVRDFKPAQFSPNTVGTNGFTILDEQFNDTVIFNNPLTLPENVDGSGFDQLKPYLVGSLWHSDNSGYNFSVSIDNIYGVYFDYSSVEFSSISSTEGTYIVSQIVKNDGDYLVRSMISWNRGASWSNALTNDHLNDKVDVTTSPLFLFGPLQSADFHDFSPIFARSFTPGIILGVGALGFDANDLFAEVDGDVYLSRNGGVMFKKILQHKHHCVYLNQGVCIACIAGGISTNEIKLSCDSGNKWQSKEATTSATFHSLLADPDPTGSKVIGVGVDGEKTVIVVGDFAELNLKKCTEEKFETWKPNNCVLGHKNTVHRLQADANCWSQEMASITATENCDCTYQDFECAFGFEKNTAGGCTALNSTFLNPTPCNPNGLHSVFSGLVKIPGNTCDSGYDWTDRIDLPCKYNQFDDSMGNLVLATVALVLMLISVICCCGCFIFANRRKIFTSYVQQKIQQHTQRGQKSEELGMLGMEEDDDDDELVFARETEVPSGVLVRRSANKNPEDDD